MDNFNSSQQVVAALDKDPSRWDRLIEWRTDHLALKNPLRTETYPGSSGS
jgi:hypothetical protein